MINLTVLIAIGMFLYRRFLKKELYDNKNFTYVLCGLLVISGGYYLLIGLVYRDLFLIILGPMSLYGSYRELQRARLLETRVLEETEILEEEVDETNGRKFLVKAPTNPANFAIGCVMGAMFFFNINIFIMISVIIVLNVIAPKEQSAPDTKSNDKFVIFPIKPLLLIFGGMLATQFLLATLLGTPAVQ